MLEECEFNEDDLDLVDRILEEHKSNSQASFKSSITTNNNNTNSNGFNSNSASNSKISMFRGQPLTPLRSLSSPIPHAINSMNIMISSPLKDHSRSFDSVDKFNKKIKSTKNPKKSIKLTTPMQTKLKQTKISDFAPSIEVTPSKRKKSLNDYSNYKADINRDCGLPPKVPYDPEAARFWLYLKNKSFREYQFKAVETCLFYNTLVCLPTGLGKTFIAANVILNYYKWFPSGKIFFLAPTKPLVSQQKEALECINSINCDDIIQLTGTINAKKRTAYYKDKRIFFMTPQTLENDLEENNLNREDIVCLIFDEAHKSTGNYAYSNICSQVDKANAGYRIIALTATPGNNIEKIQEVLNKLCISRMIVKDEDDEDVKPYIHEKEIKEVIIRQNKGIGSISELFNVLLAKPIKGLNDLGVFPKTSRLYIHKPFQLNRLLLLQMLEEFNTRHDELSLLLGFELKAKFFELIGILTSLCQAKKILNEQGIKAFKEYFNTFSTNLKNKHGNINFTKKSLIESEEFKKLSEVICKVEKTGENHPKMLKLLEILIHFFNDQENIQKKSKAIIFTNNRASATEIHDFLKQKPNIESSIFVGQSKTTKIIDGKTLLTEGVNQKRQIEILKKFKEGELNTLIATCIGEEGLDIGEVDLIICYDNGFSPIRMVQRMGRTGRKRAGKVIVLLMEGKEYFMYKNSIKRSKKLKEGLKLNSLTDKQKQSKTKVGGGIKNKCNFSFYSFNPRMLPDEIVPVLKFIDDINEKKLNDMKEKQDVAKDLSDFENRLDDNEIDEDEQQSLLLQGIDDTNPYNPLSLAPVEEIYNDDDDENVNEDEDKNQNSNNNNNNTNKKKNKDKDKDKDKDKMITTCSNTLIAKYIEDYGIGVDIGDTGEGSGRADRVDYVWGADRVDRVGGVDSAGHAWGVDDVGHVQSVDDLSGLDGIGDLANMNAMDDISKDKPINTNDCYIAIDNDDNDDEEFDYDQIEALLNELNEKKNKKTKDNDNDNITSAIATIVDNRDNIQHSLKRKTRPDENETQYTLAKDKKLKFS